MKLVPERFNVSAVLATYDRCCTGVVISAVVLFFCCVAVWQGAIDTDSCEYFFSIGSQLFKIADKVHAVAREERGLQADMAIGGLQIQIVDKIHKILEAFAPAGPVHGFFADLIEISGN